jgi:transcription initiation factor TFIIIB Brf1 subunit/transcription initiation factor TFIIB
MFSQTTDLWNAFKNIKFSESDSNSDSNSDTESNSESHSESNSESDSLKSDSLKSDSLKSDSLKSDSLKSEPNNLDKCSYCSDGTICPEEGRLLCQNCGVDHGPLIDITAEWRYYGSGDNKNRSDPTRCGMPTSDLLPDSIPGTVLLGRGNELYRKLHKWNQMSYKEKSLINDFNEFRDKCLKHNIPVSIIDKTKALYKALRYDDKLYDMKRGTTKKGLMAACTYESCRLKGLNKSPKEIADIFEIKVSKVTNGIKDFKKLMHCKDQEYVNKMRASTPKDFVEFFGKKIGLSDKYIAITLHIAQMADLLGIVPENIPHSMAVGCLYLTIYHYGLDFNKKYVSYQCQISEVTISKTCKKLEPFKKYLLPTNEDDIKTNKSITSVDNIQTIVDTPT